MTATSQFDCPLDYAKIINLNRMMSLLITGTFFDRSFSLYEEATLLSARSGYLQHAALANERYAESLLEIAPKLSRRDEAKYRLEQAIRCYSEWGAHQKVKILRQSHAVLLCV